MSQISITQSPEIAVIWGAYYEIFSKDDSGEQIEKAKPKYYQQFTFTYKTSLASVRTASLEEADKFSRLVAGWHRERSVAASTTDMAMCPSYQKIIAMGEVAIPLVLSRLQSEGDEPDHWFWALRILTDANPVNEKDRGDIVKMATAWLEWGKNHGYAR